MRSSWRSEAPVKLTKYQTAIPSPRPFDVGEGKNRNLLAIAIEAVLASNGLPGNLLASSWSGPTIDARIGGTANIPESGTNLVTLYHPKSRLAFE